MAGGKFPEQSARRAMASVTDDPPSGSFPTATEPAEERFVDEQIRRTRRALKVVDFVAGAITLTIGVLATLLTLAILEHWVVPGGWNTITRAVLFTAFVAGAAWYAWRIFWPLLSKPINPAFAAQTIEQSSPTLKNSLLNLLLLRQRRRQISRQVYQAIEQQAAQRLAQVPIDSVIDRSSILRLGYVLVAVVAVCALYRVLSPKDPLASVGRVLMPWADIPVPSRVQIVNVTPGDTSAARGEQLVVTAEILGASPDEPVRLRYSAADEQVVDQEVPMTPQEGGLRFEGRLPGRAALGGSGGIQSDLTYWIEAGDARSASYDVKVFSQPTLVVEKIRYEYPIYTRYAPREVENTGDISAVEGTNVTITAVANQPIESAYIDFDADGRHDLLMKSEDRTATVSFPLELAKDRRTPRYHSYALRYTTREGRKNPSPPTYRIDVEQDYSPEIQLLAPTEETIDVALSDEVTIEVEARDPDYAVRNVAILGEVNGERVLKRSLLAEDRTGRFVGNTKIVPEDLNLKPGDVLEYWGAAADNRRPEPNLAFTRHQKLRILGPPDLSGGEQQGGQGESQGGQQGGDQGTEDEQGTEGEQGGAGQAGGGQGDQQGESQEESGGQGAAGGEGGEGESQQQSDAAGESSENQSGQGGGATAGGSDQQPGDDPAGEAGQSDSPNGDNADAGEQAQPGENAAGGKPSGGASKVSPEGDDDGTAFERMAEHFQNGQQDQGEQQDQQAGQQQQASAEEDGQSESAEAEQQQGAEGSEQTEGAAGEQQQAGEAGEQQDGEQQAGDQQSQQGAEGDQAPQHGGEGQEKSQPEGERADTGGEMEENRGPAGAGENPGENEGAPNPAGASKPNDKPTEDPAGDKMNDQEAPMEGQQKRESDSQGGQGGDRTGGGQEGGGQRADDKGTGGAGENQAAEEGGGQASEQGEGETGEKAGDQQLASGQTGESSGDQPGQGSKQSGQAGEQAGGEQADSGEHPEGQQPSDPSAAGGQPPSGGGTGGSSSAPPPSGDAEPGDAANLDYARAQTDLVLEKLDDQLRKQQVDQELLDKLGWTPDELKRFVERWKNLKAQAETAGPQADEAQELDNALRSLGLRRAEGPRFQAESAKDKLRDLQDAYRGRTPMEYQERMRKYVKGTATAQEE